jgi:hypothetical protein
VDLCGLERERERDRERERERNVAHWRILESKLKKKENICYRLAEPTNR